MAQKKVLIYFALIIFIIDCILISIKIFSDKNSKGPIHKAKPHYKYSIFLTSDDGPLKGSKYLDEIIKLYEAPFTLFLVGKPLSQDVNLRPYLQKYIDNRFIYLGNHSFSHANFHYKRYYKNPSIVIEDFIKNKQYLDLKSNVARLPGRNVWVLNSFLYKGEQKALQVAKKLSLDYNFKIFGWDYELQHNGKGEVLKDAKYHYKKIKEMLRRKRTFTLNQLVVLMHDQMFTNEKSTKVLGELILLLQDDNEVKLKYLYQYKMPFSKFVTK